MSDDDRTVKTAVFRAAFIGLPAQLSDDDKAKDKKPSYTVTAMFDEEDKAAIKPLKKLAEFTLKEAKGAGANPKHYKMPFNDGTARYERDGIEHFKGQVYCTLKNSSPITVVDEFNEPVDLQDQSAIRSGSYYRAVVGAYAWKDPNGTNEGVSFRLAALQKIKDGEVISGGGALTPEEAQKMFDDSVSEKKEKKKKKKKKKD